MALFLTSRRLRIEPLAEHDVAAFVSYRRDPEVARWQGWGLDYGEQQARALVLVQSGWSLPPPGEWLQLAVRPLSGAGLLGDVAVQRREDQPDTFEIGCTLARSSQGQGIASEAVGCVLTHLVVDAGAHRVIASCDARNTASAALLRRVGMRHEAHEVEADFFRGEWTTVDRFAVLGAEIRRRSLMGRT
ncbi:GNAT family N-acetyltransferase [uncultured Friedmanniella sp.]|uniref:GNAT family N-acetyltransferase n=1 Tax=uncultured Friedmanniella sp. TaxID=335381 RepID=UPI0035CB2858